MNLDARKLPPDTAKFWRRCENEPLLSGFYLMGGTALALQLQHRISEDLDFFYPHPILPVDKLNRFFARLKREGETVKHKASWDVYDDFKQAGESLFDYHQTLTVSGTKCSFTSIRAFGTYTKKLLVTPLRPDGPTVPDIDELFATKAVLVSERDKSRDWLDLYILMKDHKFTIQDFFNAYERAGMSQHATKGLESLTAINLQHKDEGYAMLIQPAPTLTEMRDFFAAQKKIFEVSKRATSKVDANSTAQQRRMKL
jgi:hypothetical protein